jgi:hypothetical protein
MPRKFTRSSGQRAYRKLFLIATEGKETEPQYFSLFNNREATIQVKCLKSGNDSAPPHVLKRIKQWLNEHTFRDADEAWLVVDKDQWTDEQLMQLHDWSLNKKNYGFSLSNPKFEYWLLLHFEDGPAHRCSERLKQYLPNYNKSIDRQKFTPARICDAIHRAKQRDTPPCADWPRIIGATTVYRLVEKLLSPS